MPVIRLENFQQFTAINVLSDPGQIGGPKVIPNCVQIVLKWTLPGGKQGNNVLYGRAAGIPSPTAAQATAIHQALTTGAAWTALAAKLSVDTALSGVTLRSVHIADQPIIASTSASVPGTNAGQALPNEMAVAVTLRTAEAGVSGRGRFFVPGFAVAVAVAGNVVEAATITALQNWATGFTAIFSGQGYTWVLGLPARAAYTGATGTQHPARTATSLAIASAVVRNNTWDSQRRRGLK